ncbi:uncharacterized protein LOC122398776 isoform X2 [Colletes gigas]|uniref:uncharacterized protein LOC122398776 isoform X2 n=1 Tax=Colletes gigas TaxID=935657 RepID=UPI001C9AE201|nr:uncharacterized protein LOC122398776 isoform X2 [Colletes gigas]
MALTLNTDDKLEYRFYPAATRQLQFRVKAANDAHVALTTGPQDSQPMYEVFIGGWGNSKSVIRKNKSKPDVAEADTPGILSNDEFRGFWIRWDDDALSVGKEGEASAFLTYTDSEPLTVSHFGLCTAWGASGEWLIEGQTNALYTRNDLTYKYHPVRTGGSVLVEVRAKSNAHIALTKQKGESTPMYEIMLGGWENTASVIRYNRKQPDKVHMSTPNLLNANQAKKFAISWLDGLITVRTGDLNGPVIMEWQDPKPFDVNYVGVRTGWGATGKWNLRIEHYPPRSGSKKGPSAPPAEVGDVIWCGAVGGMVPPNAIEGGRDEEPLFVGRARHEGALLPGKVKPSHSVCYVAWGGQEHGKSEYEVLCSANPPTWVPTSGNNIPPNAIPAGESEDGETLYVGRVHHEDTLTIGKVQPSHSVCYIPFAGSEVGFPEYEIMIWQ